MGIRVCVGLITLCALVTATLAGLATARASGPPLQTVPLDLTQVIATAADVRSLAPCSRDVVTYGTDGPSMQDVARWIEVGLAPPGTLQIVLASVNEMYLSDTDQHDMGTVLEVVHAFPDTSLAETYMQMWRQDMVMAALRQLGDSAGGYQREDVASRTFGDETIAYRYRYASGSPDAYALVFRRGTVVVALKVSTESATDCSIEPGMPFLDGLASIITSRFPDTPGPAPEPGPNPDESTPRGTVVLQDDFSRNQGWQNDTGGRFVLDEFAGQLTWHVERSSEQYFFTSLPEIGGDVRVRARVRATHWDNNCDLYFGLVENPQKPWPTGAFVSFGWFGDGVGPRIAPRIRSADGAEVGWDATNPATFIRYEMDRWYRVAMELRGRTWKIIVTTDDGQPVGQLAGEMQAAPTRYRYFALFSPNDGDWPTGDGLFDDLVVESLNGESPPLPPSDDEVIFEDDFDGDQGWANETDGHFVIDAAAGRLIWHVDRSVDEHFFIRIPETTGNVRFRARLQATQWANNCDFYFGLVEKLGKPWPSGAFVSVGWFGAGVGNRVVPSIIYRDGTGIGWDAENPATYINYDLGRWYWVTMELVEGHYTITVSAEDGYEVGRLDGNLPRAHASYRYFALFNPRDGDWPTGDGMLDDLRIERITR